MLLQNHFARMPSQAAHLQITTLRSFYKTWHRGFSFMFCQHAGTSGTNSVTGFNFTCLAKTTADSGSSRFRADREAPLSAAGSCGSETRWIKIGAMPASPALMPLQLLFPELTPEQSTEHQAADSTHFSQRVLYELRAVDGH